MLTIDSVAIRNKRLFLRLGFIGSPLEYGKAPDEKVRGTDLAGFYRTFASRFWKIRSCRCRYGLPQVCGIASCSNSSGNCGHKLIYVKGSQVIAAVTPHPIMNALNLRCEYNLGDRIMRSMLITAGRTVLHSF